MNSSRFPAAITAAAFWIALGLALDGCSVMRFKNGDTEPQDKAHTQWHHNLAYGLYEVSPPVDLKRRCPDGAWADVSTRQDFWPGLLGRLDQIATSLYVTGGIDLWDAQVVEYHCGKPAAK